MNGTINNEDLMNSILTLAYMCASQDTDNCDLTLNTSKGSLVCHIDFEYAEADLDKELLDHTAELIAEAEEED